MTPKSDIQRDYFLWLCRQVVAPGSYSMLMDKLHRTDYVWIVEMDKNRASDGIILRYKFSVEQGYNDEESAWVKQCLSGPCSLLELLVALTKRIEADIMYDPEFDDRSSEWFKDMIKNLGLLEYDNKHYNENIVDYILNRFISRKYDENGVGNVFLRNDDAENSSKADEKPFRNLELWAQMNQYYANKCEL